MARLSSPRVRRRLTWSGGAVALAAGVALVVVLIPSHGPPNPVPVTTEGLAKLATPTSRHVAAADRRAIDRVLDRFIPAAVGRADVRTAYRLAGPEMKVSTSYADWQRWNVPVPAYPVRGTSFHDWTTIDAGRGYVDFNLLVHPKPGHRLGDWVFDGQMVRRQGTWLVNRLYTIAILQPVRGSKHEIGPADFQAPPPSSSAPAGTARLSRVWLLAGAGAIVLVLLLPVALGVLALNRRRRWRAALKARRRGDDPLRPAERTAVERERETANRL